MPSVTLLAMSPKSRMELLDIIGIAGHDCVEVGVLRGDFTREILSRNPKSLLLVDCWCHQDEHGYDDPANLSDASFAEIYNGVISSFEPDIASKRVSILRDFSVLAASKIDMKFDFAYIDACHNYKDVLCDLCCWSMKIKPGGWLCGHDYTGQYHGVKNAVDTFCEIFKKEVSIVTDEVEWASYGIQM